MPHGNILYCSSSHTPLPRQSLTTHLSLFISSNVLGCYTWNHYVVWFLFACFCLSLIILRFINHVACINSLFPLIAKYYFFLWTYYYLFILSPVAEPLDGFSGMVGSWGRCVVCLILYCESVFQNDCTILLSHQQWWKFQFLHFLLNT